LLLVVDNETLVDSLSAVAGGLVFVSALFLPKKRNLSLGLVVGGGGGGGEIRAAASNSA
jgi:hypothetical protein